jgi:hypothetical protein
MSRPITESSVDASGRARRDRQAAGFARALATSGPAFAGAGFPGRAHLAFVRQLDVMSAQNTFGEDAMLAVHARATELRPKRVIVVQPVEDAIRELYGGTGAAIVPSMSDAGPCTGG